MNYFQYRESPKYYIIFVVGKMRELILKRTKILLDKQLIDDIKDIFKLKFKTLSYILENVDKLNKEKIYSFYRSRHNL